MFTTKKVKNGKAIINMIISHSEKSNFLNVTKDNKDNVFERSNLPENLLFCTNSEEKRFSKTVEHCTTQGIFTQGKRRD